jgi:hypothetical protein
MPQLDGLLAKAQNNETRKTFTRGNRPDRIASGQGFLPTADEKVSTPKVEPKWSQTEAKVEPEPEPKWSQTEAKVEPRKSKKIQSRAKVEPEPEPKWSQTEAKVEPKVRLAPHPSSVVGLQRKALLFLYESCRFLGSRITPPFAIQNIADGCKTSISATKKAIQRLIEKKILLRAEYKDGRSGWTRYELPASIYNALLHEETGAKVESNCISCL